MCNSEICNKSLFHHEDLKNIPIRLEFTGITILMGTFGPHIVGNTSTQTHTTQKKSFCFLLLNGYCI